MKITKYGIGGYDPTKPNDNIVEEYEIPDPPFFGSVDAAKARIVLHRSGLLKLVEEAIDSMPEPQRTEAKIRWEFETTINRHDELAVALGKMLGLDDEKLDALFFEAASLS
jgi:hypothetical protein